MRFSLLFITLLCRDAAGNIYNNRDCRDWGAPQNKNEYPKWHYCNRRPGDGNTRYKFLTDKMPPADVPPHKCGKGLVLRHDADGIVCANYGLGDDYGGPCDDLTCCVKEVCTSYKCPKNWVKKSDADQISCLFGCAEDLCCDPVLPVPKRNPAGLIFVDRDPKRFSFGGNITILRAPDETDIKEYRLYWGYANMVRKVPSCGLKNPVSWETIKWRSSKLIKKVKVTGCDITFELPMGTKPPPRDSSCTIKTNRQDRITAGTDPCNPHYIIVAAWNENGEKPVMATNEQQVGPRHPISDYEDEYDLPCAEGGITMGHDIPASEDYVLGKRNGVNSAAECAKLCREYNGAKGPCRYWTWAYPNKGHTAKTCWMESQILQKTHYGVRVVGPAVCPTKDGERPTGKERPRCNRWIRKASQAPFADEKGRNQWIAKGLHWVQKPNLPDVPLGPYDNAEECQAICDMDMLCIGFVYMKRDPSDKWFHSCFMIRQDVGFKSNIFYDSWMCSREGMAPLLNGYTMNTNPFGYTKCSQAPSTEEQANDVDCCAALCDADKSCASFTFWGDKKCQLFKSCSIQKVNKVEGCAYESCYDGYGAVTYTKDTARSMSVVDKWPQAGGDGGIPITVQTNGGMDGVEVTCVAWRDGKPTRPAVPTTVKAIKSQASLSTSFASAVVKDDIAEMLISREEMSAWIDDGQKYKIRCGVDDPKPLGLPDYVDRTIETNFVGGYQLVGAGYCKTTSCSSAKAIIPKNTPYTLAGCKKECDDHGPKCTAFWYRNHDGWCHLKIDGCKYDKVNKDANVQCFRVWKGKNPFLPGSDICPLSCTGTCAFKRQLGVYERDVFIPPRQICQAGDECATSPCGMGQTCKDPNTAPSSLNDYVCSCDADPSVTAIGTAAMCILDECAATPCGAGQDCSDPDTGYGSLNDFSCSCKSDPTVTQTGGPATCPPPQKDECTGDPCGTGQTCNDPSKTTTDIKDFTCTCDNDPATNATAKKATCELDECAASPCGPDQDCSDPDTRYSAHDNYECTCKADSTVKTVGVAAVCSQDECSSKPCGTGQTCNDPTKTPTTLKDYTCTCDSDPATKVTGGVATCELDECASSPCGTGQACTDPNTKYSSKLDFECVCQADATIKKIGAPATCSKDECASDPCGTGQTCNDPTPTIHTVKDYTCTCDSDPATKATGSKATCVLDECTSGPCGADQDCTDPDTKYSSQSDFECSCKADATIKKIGASATCSRDECASDPCGTGQTCNDPTPTIHTVKDYTCTCNNDPATKATGAKATCMLDECASSPCGTGQDCTDPDTKYSSNLDFECSCKADTSIKKVGAPATCTKDECASDPCGTGQTCNDPTPTIHTVKDYTCTCDSDPATKSTGTKATCVLDECDSGPCGADQDCTDPDTSYSSQFDYTCSCKASPTIVKVGGTATCERDECVSLPCGAQQTCSDPNKSPKSLKDYVCSCNNDPSTATGTQATCELNECTSAPCGTGQVCVDPDTRKGSAWDFTCTCMGDAATSSTGRAALCVIDECVTSPCGSQACTDPDTLASSAGDFVCSCPGGSPSKVGGIATVAQVEQLCV
eukprot:TRINITY_DN11243_c0_g1_i1.p1 TRINITY_DN11243_c0_g1~~TRINITY_DN11243_c0_g1_i1.p1  ORF type:complete len:1598 (+),score=375.37 TRINITY_DN11243_c0_g1_i1:76-4794(+)